MLKRSRRSGPRVIRFPPGRRSATQDLQSVQAAVSPDPRFALVRRGSLLSEMHGDLPLAWRRKPNRQFGAVLATTNPDSSIEGQTQRLCLAIDLTWLKSEWLSRLDTPEMRAELEHVLRRNRVRQTLKDGELVYQLFPHGGTEPVYWSVLQFMEWYVGLAIDAMRTPALLADVLELLLFSGLGNLPGVKQRKRGGRRRKLTLIQKEQVRSEFRQVQRLAKDPLQLARRHNPIEAWVHMQREQRENPQYAEFLDKFSTTMRADDLLLRAEDFVLKWLSQRWGQKISYIRDIVRRRT